MKDIIKGGEIIMVCPKCKQQYDIYNAVVNDDTGVWECPGCHVLLEEGKKDIIETLNLIVTRWSVKDRDMARKMLRAVAELIIKRREQEDTHTDRLEDEYSNYRNNEICEQRLKGRTV